MSSSCRVLQFPPRHFSREWSPAEAEQTALDYLSASAADRDIGTVLNPDVLLCVTAQLRKLLNQSPADALREAQLLFEAVSGLERFGVFDEREYVLGDLALLAAKAFRTLGNRVENRRWLDTSESHFLETVNPAPHRANVAYERLALAYELRDFSTVLDSTLPLATTFERLGMVSEKAKVLFLRAVVLKLVGRWEEAVALSRQLTREEPNVDLGVVAQAWIEIGEFCTHEEDFQGASDAYQKALPLLERVDRPIAVFSLKVAIGETLRAQGRLSEALTFLNAACGAADELNLATQLASTRLLAAETLLALGRNREAEWQVFTALPTIQEQLMVAEGLAAVNLLREAISRRALDSSNLKAVRRFLASR